MNFLGMIPVRQIGLLSCPGIPVQERMPISAAAVSWRLALANRSCLMLLCILSFWGHAGSISETPVASDPKQEAIIS